MLENDFRTVQQKQANKCELCKFLPTCINASRILTCGGETHLIQRHPLVTYSCILRIEAHRRSVWCTKTLTTEEKKAIFPNETKKQKKTPQETTSSFRNKYIYIQKRQRFYKPLVLLLMLALGLGLQADVKQNSLIANTFVS